MQGYRRLSVPFFFVLILGLCPGGGRDAAGRIMDEGRPEPPPRPRIRGTGRAVRQGEGVAALPRIMAGACRMDQDRGF